MNDQAIAENPLARIHFDPAKRFGQPCIRDLRITVHDVLEYFAGGMSEDEILQEFPDLQSEDFAAIYAYAASRNLPGFIGECLGRAPHRAALDGSFTHRPSA